MNVPLQPGQTTDGHPAIQAVAVTHDEWLAAQAEIERLRSDAGRKTELEYLRAVERTVQQMIDDGHPTDPAWFAILRNCLNTGEPPRDA